MKFDRRNTLVVCLTVLLLALPLMAWGFTEAAANRATDERLHLAQIEACKTVPVPTLRMSCIALVKEKP